MRFVISFLVCSLLAFSLVITACGGGVAPTVVSQPTPSPEPVIKDFPGEGTVVQPARATWDTGYFQEALYSKALEELGYKVLDHQELRNKEFYEAVASGEVDFWANSWFPQLNLYKDIFDKKASIAGTVASFGALQGYMVDRAGAQEFNITSLDDFKRNEVREAYDADGNGKADFYACQDGWSCKTIIGAHLDAFELRDHIDELTGDYTAAMEEAIRRFEAGEHILFFTWTPNWTVSHLRPGEEVVWIEIPKAVHPGLQDLSTLTIPGIEGCVNDPCLMGFPGNHIQVFANNEFLEANPSAAKLFEVMAVPLTDISNQNNRMREGEDSQANIDAHADEWIALNRDLFNVWLAQAREVAQ